MFTQVLEFVNKYEFNKCVKRYLGDYHIHEPNCWNHFIQLLFGQMTSLESLRSICLCLKARIKISFITLAFKQYVNHITLSRANEQRDWRLFADFGNYLILLVCPLYADSSMYGIDIYKMLFRFMRTPFT